MLDHMLVSLERPFTSEYIGGAEHRMVRASLGGQLDDVDADETIETPQLLFKATESSGRDPVLVGSKLRSNAKPIGKRIARLVDSACLRLRNALPVKRQASNQHA